jgi:hypothetical protein
MNNEFICIDVVNDNDWFVVFVVLDYVFGWVNLFLLIILDNTLIYID